MSSSESRELEAVRLRAVALEQRYRQVQGELAAYEQDLARLRLELVDSRARIATLELEPDFERLARLEVEVATAKLTEADSADLVASLRRELEESRAHATAKAVAMTAQVDGQIGELIEREDAAQKQLADVTAAAERTARELEVALLQAEKVEPLEIKLSNQVTLAKLADGEYAVARAQIVELRARLDDPTIQATRVRAVELATEVKVLASQLASERARVLELEQRVSGTRDVSEVDFALAEAAKAKRVAAEHIETLRAAERKAVDADQRAAVADMVSQSMAKDVTEMLRRVADADLRVRTAGRDREDIEQRVKAAEATNAELAANDEDLKRRTEEAEARLAQIEGAFSGEIGEVRSQLTAKLAGLERELAAERSTAMALVDRKNQLERELGALRKQLEDHGAKDAALRTDAAELAAAREAEAAVLETAKGDARAAAAQAAEREAEIEALQRRVSDLENLSGTAESTALADARATAEQALRTAETAKQRAAQQTTEHTTETAMLGARVRELDGALTEARAEIKAFEVAKRRAEATDQRSRKSIDDRLADAERRARAFERDSVALRAEVADAVRREVAADGRSQASIAELRRKVVEDQERYSAVERRLANAESARAFAADTEKEIAQLKQKLRETQAALHQKRLDRDFGGENTETTEAGPLPSQHLKFRMLDEDE